MGSTWAARVPPSASRTPSRALLDGWFGDAHHAQALREALEERGMAAGALGIILDDDAQRRIGLARQADGAVVLKPKFDVESDASSVFIHLHRARPWSLIAQATQPFSQASKEESRVGPCYPQAYPQVCPAASDRPAGAWR